LWARVKMNMPLAESRGVTPLISVKGIVVETKTPALTIDNEILTVKRKITDPEKRINWLISKGTHILAKWLETTNFHQNVIRGGLRVADTDCEEETE